jgi:hypothetical protein
MLTPFRPAVFACPMRTVHGVKPKGVWPPPYPAWPEITNPSGFYTLPTLASHPAIIRCLWRPRCCDQFWARWNSADRHKDSELFYAMFPDVTEDILAKLPPITDDSFTTLVNDLLDPQTNESGGLARFLAALGIADPEWITFAYYHEMGHYVSFLISRPTIMEVNRIASGIFDLFKKLSVSNLPACENFWDEFQEGNDTLVNYLDQALILEELRANLCAFAKLDPLIRVSIEPDLRKAMAEEDAISFFGRPIFRPDLFDKLGDVTNENWIAAYRLSILAEYSPKDPIKRLHFLCSKGVDTHSEMLLDVQVARFEQVGWEVDLTDSMHRTLEINFRPPCVYAVSAVQHWSLSDVRELVFLESLRQQLAQFFGVSLVCPFQQRGRTCCGFGHYMRAIWEQVRPEYRSARSILHPKTGKEIVVRPPRTVCLHYGLG